MTPRLHITRAASQRLRIVARGADVPHLRPETQMRDLPDPATQHPDVIGLFAKAAGYGLFSAKAGLFGPVEARSERLASTNPNVAIWSLRLENVDVEALRVLADVIAILDLDSADITNEDRVTENFPDHRMLALPSCERPGEFALTYERPAKSNAARGVRIVFATPPAETTMDSMLDALDAWGGLLMHGAYAESRDGMDGAFAEDAVLEDARTVGVALPMVQGMNELMFCAILNLARRTHALISPIARIEIN